MALRHFDPKRIVLVTLLRVPDWRVKLAIEEVARRVDQALARDNTYVVRAEGYIDYGLIRTERENGQLMERVEVLTSAHITAECISSVMAVDKYATFCR